MNSAYPKELRSLANHFRKVRLDRVLCQSDVAKELGVTNDSINNWENNHHQPKVSQAKKIIKFIGYVPFNLQNSSSGKRWIIARQVAGLSFRRLSERIRIDAGTLADIEAGLRKPTSRTQTIIDNYIVDTITTSGTQKI